MTRLPDCVLFDLDGTLLDSLPGIESSVRAAFASVDLPPPHGSLRSLIGPPIRTILALAGKITDEQTLDSLELAFRQDYDTEGWKETVCFPNAAQILLALRRHGRRLFVVSNKPRHISLKNLERENILEVFEAIVTRDSRLPPYSGKAEMLQELLVQRGIPPADSVLVGDTIEDAKAAAQVGVGFIYMTHGYGSLGDLPVSAACCLENFSQFLPMIAEELVRD
jgi:phosphoglycolate phosphatase